jgi:hypothetical protein
MKTYEFCFREFIADKRLGQFGTSFTREEMNQWFANRYPDMSDLDNQFPKKTTNYTGRVRWKPRPIKDDLFFHVHDNRFRLYRADTDPPPFYASLEPREGRSDLEIGELRIGPYNFRQCQSLFGYAKDVHERSGGICQLCGCGSGEEVSFDLWRQMTVEHLLGRSQGGYLNQIRLTIKGRLPNIPVYEQEQIAKRIDSLNTITACQFCNSTTSQSIHDKSMTKLISESEGDAEDVILEVKIELEKVLARKRADIERKIQSIRIGFDEQIRPSLLQTRSQHQ